MISVSIASQWSCPFQASSCFRNSFRRERWEQCWRQAGNKRGGKAVPGSVLLPPGCQPRPSSLLSVPLCRQDGFCVPADPTRVWLRFATWGTPAILEGCRCLGEPVREDPDSGGDDPIGQDRVV